MIEFLRRLVQRKLVQWSLAYIAAAFAVIQGLDVVANRFGWSTELVRIVILALTVGFCVMLVLAWYHGERGAQRIGGAELLIIALLLLIGGVMVRYLGPAMVRPPAAQVANTQAPAASIMGSHKATATSPAPPAVLPATNAASIPAKSVAVLPFENLSSEKENDYFVAGMQDLILTKLADIADLKVISRTSTRKYASHPEDLRTIGRQLGVATILEGSVQRHGNDVLINVQLMDATTDAHLWAGTYRRTLKDVFGVEGEVAEKVAVALKARLSPSETSHLATTLSNNPTANDLYLRAEYFTYRGEVNLDVAPFKQAVAVYRQALALVPDFALARARLSYAQSNLAWYGGGGEDVKQLQAGALANAKQALKLAPDLPEARLAFGYCHYYGKGDYATALEDFTRVLELRPNDPAALSGLGQVQRRLGRFDAAIAAFQQAVARDPRNPHRSFGLAETYTIVSRWPEAEAAYRRTLAVDPTSVLAKAKLSGMIVLARGDIPAALSAAAGDAPLLRWQRARMLTYQREYRDALTLLDAIPASAVVFTAPYTGPKALQLASLYRLLGEEASARALYAKALPEVRAWPAASDIPIYKAHAWTLVAEAELGVGRADNALAALARSQALIAQSGDQAGGPWFTVMNAAVYARAGRADLAVPLLRDALAAPGVGWGYSPVMLWLDPAWDPIREHARYQALLRQYAQHKPAVLYAAAGAKP